MPRRRRRRAPAEAETDTYHPQSYKEGEQAVSQKRNVGSSRLNGIRSPGTWRPDQTAQPFPRNGHQRRSVTTDTHSQEKTVSHASPPQRTNQRHNLRASTGLATANRGGVSIGPKLSLPHRPKREKKAALDGRRSPGESSPAILGKIPTPTEEYLTQSALPPAQLPSPQPLLLVIDLNGTLILRDRSRKTFHVRPHAMEFKNHILANYAVMVWSSAQPANVANIVSQLFTPEERQKLVAVWARDKLGLSKAHYLERVQVYKRLHSVWRDQSIQSSYPKSLDSEDKGEAPLPPPTSSEQRRSSSTRSNRAPANRRWDQSNTILIDDSRLKAAAQPFNLIELPEFVDLVEEERSSRSGKPPVLMDVQRMLEILARQQDVSRYLRALVEKESQTTMDHVLKRTEEQFVDDEARRKEDEKTQVHQTKEDEEETDWDTDTEEGGVKLD